MSRRISISSLVGASLLLVMLGSHLVAAQEQNALTNSQSTSAVTAAVSGDRVRFTAPSTVVQMRLEVYAANGEKLVDNEIRGGNVIDWHLRDGQAERLADGSYLCVITGKSLSGRLDQKLGRITIENAAASVQPIDATQLSAQQTQAVGPLEENASLTVLKEGDNQTATVISHNGEEGQITRGRGALSFRIGDFFRGKDIEQMRLTPEGNLGIGLTQPQAKLDVDGLIRSRQGIVFPDGSVQFSAARKTFGGGSLMPDQSQRKLVQGQEAGLAPDTSGTGTTGRIPRWLDGPNGVLSDSNISELTGAIGINGLPDTRFRLDVNGSTRIRGSNPGFNLEGQRSAGNIWLFQTVDDDGRFRLFGQDNVNPGVERLTIGLDTGNVGIGTANPVGRLHVKGSSPVRILGDVSTLAGSEYVDFMARNSPFSSDMGGMRIQRQPATGDIDTLFLAGASGFSASEKMRVRGNGNVGIGTPNPTARLHVLGAEAAGITGVYSEGTVGVHGFSTGGLGVRGVSPDGWGVRGDSTNGYGVRGNSTNSDGVFGGGKNGVHGLSGSTTDSGVWGQNTGGGYGVAGSTNSSAESGIPGVLGQNDGTGIGVKGIAATGGTGVWGDNGGSNTTGHAGYFNGRVNINGNLLANNLAGGIFSQQHTETGNPIASFPGSIVDAVTITAPDRGVLFISAFVNIVTVSGGYMQHDFRLEDGAGALLTQTTEEGANGGDKLQRTSHLSWMLRVDAGQSVTIRTVLRRGQSAWVSTQFYDHNLSVAYLRAEY